MNDLIQNLIDVNIVKYGNFTLKNGGQSNVYCDLRKVISYPKLKKVLCYELSKLINNMENTVIAGIPMGGIPYATTMSDMNNIPMIIIRNSRKVYGMMNLIEGDLQNREVILIEDVVTSGGSVLEIIDSLENEHVIIKQIIVILDREAGGMKKISDRGYNIKSLFKLSELNLHRHINPIITKINRLIMEKHTNIILSADIDNPEKVIDLIEKTGDYILGVKLHTDIYKSQNISYLTNQIKILKKKYNLIIIEDRKCADIGYIVRKQVSIMSEWADIVTAYGITGSSMIEAINDVDMGVLLIHNLSTKDNLIDDHHSKAIEQMALKNKNVIGFITQEKVFDGYLHFTPGVRIDITEDSMGQTYRTPKTMKDRGTDIFIIGRGIYQSKNPIESAIKYKQLCY